MKRKFFIRTLIISLSAILLFAVASGILIWHFTERLLKDDLIRLSDVIKDEAQRENANLENLVSFEVSGDKAFRISFIAADGTMLEDSLHEDEYENHLSRPEIKSALENKPSFVKRHSTTLSKSLMYYAVPFKLAATGETCVLRVAIESSASTNAVLSALPFLVVISAALVVAMVVTNNKYNNSLLLPMTEIKKQLHTINTGEFKKLPVDKDNAELLPVINELNEIAENMQSLVRVRSEFFANASHELNTPLTYISGYAELMEKGLLKDDEKIAECGKKIREQTSRMNNLIADMLDLSRLENSSAEINYSNVNLKELLDSVADMFRLQAKEKNVTIGIRCYEENVFTSEKLLKDILVNLVQNAVKYNKENGAVDITVKKLGHTLDITVADTGIGIPKEYRERVFERFYRVDKGRSRENGGTGLGLAIVKHSAARLKGSVALEKSSENGSVFVVTLPLDNSAPNS